MLKKIIFGSLLLFNSLVLPFKSSLIGFGSYPLKGEDCTEAVKNALSVGYRIIDTATFYANLSDIGRSIKGYDRESLFIISKVWPDSHEPNQIRNDLAQTLKQLETSYLDAYLLHWPNHKKSIKKTLLILQELKSKGFIRLIGMSNVTVNHLKRASELVDVKIDCVQVEMHPEFCDFELLNYCNERDIKIQAWAPLARGRLNSNKTLAQIGNKYNKTSPQIALRWIVQHGCIPLPGSKNKEHTLQNLAIFDFELSKEDMALIDEIARKGKRERVSSDMGLGFTDEFDFSFENCWSASSN